MQRSEIEGHPSFPFNDFRTNDASFLLLDLYWPAVLSQALGDEAADVVPLGESDQDVDHYGTPNLLHFWLPKRGRGVRLMLNDPPDPDGEFPHSKLFASAEMYERPVEWDLPTDGQIADRVFKMEVLVLIADTDPAVADAVAAAAKTFLQTDISLAQMGDYCTALEKDWMI